MFGSRSNYSSLQPGMNLYRQPPLWWIAIKTLISIVCLVFALLIAIMAYGNIWTNAAAYGVAALFLFLQSCFG